MLDRETGIASDKCHRNFLFKTFHPGQIEEAIKNLRDIQLTCPSLNATSSRVHHARRVKILRRTQKAVKHSVLTTPESLISAA